MSGKSNDVSTQEKQDREAGIISDYASSLYLISRIDHVRYLKGDGTAALVLSHIVNLFRLKDAGKDRKKLRKDGLWFKCPAKGIQKSLNMSNGRQQTAIKKLQGLGILQTEHRGGFSLWVRIVADKLVAIAAWDRERQSGSAGGIQPNGIPPASQTESPSPAKRNPPGPLYKNPPSKKPSNGRPSDDGALSGVLPFGESKKGKSLETAEKLLRGLQGARKVMRRPNLKSWAAEMDKLVVETCGLLGVERKEACALVEEVVADHVANLQDRYQPKAYSAASFRERFVNLKEAMERRREEEKKPKAGNPANRRMFKHCGGRVEGPLTPGTLDFGDLIWENGTWWEVDANGKTIPGTRHLPE